MARSKLDASVDGNAPEFIIRLPRMVHLGAALFALLFVGLEYGKACLDASTADVLESVTTTLPGAGGVVLAFYAAFYARQTFLMTRDRERIIRTLEFSRQFSLPPMTEAREVIVMVYNRVLHRFEQNQERHAAVKARQVIAKRIGDAFESRGTGTGNPHDEALVGPTLLLLDYFEDLAVGIKMKTLDEDVARDLLRTPVESNWVRFRLLVDLIRAKAQQDSIFENFEWLRNRWS